MESKEIMIVKEESLQEFADKYIVSGGNGRTMDRRDVINPYEFIGKSNLFVRRTLIDKPIEEVPLIVEFSINDELRGNRAGVNVLYEYTVEEYDDISLQLVKLSETVKMRAI